jgi:hypothetical protein
MRTRSIALLSKLAAKIVELPDATATAAANGELQPGETIVARIRKVSAKEMVVAAGATPLLYGLVRERREDEGQDEFLERLQTLVNEDPDLRIESLKQDLANTRALVALGVTGIGFRDASGATEIEDVHLTLEGDVTPDLLAGDQAALVAAIQEFSSSGRRVGGADQTAAFPAEQAGDPDQPRGAGLRDEHDAVPQPTAG